MQRAPNSSRDATDVSSDLRHAEALLKTGALQRAIFKSASFSSIATDAVGVIQIFNVGAEHMLGYKAADVVNRITPADISDPQELIARARALSIELDTPVPPGFGALVFRASRGIEDSYELTYIRKDGSRLAAVVSVTALCDAENAIIGYLLMGTDDTGRKQAEEARRKVEQERDQILLDHRRALEEVNTLRGMIPICAWCKKVRDDQGYWQQLEGFLSAHTQATFTHGMCTDCSRRVHTS
jgi:PAS fold